jgi:leader peptidase (prepilin peptidase)/N-methyltransferase
MITLTTFERPPPLATGLIASGGVVGAAIAIGSWGARGVLIVTVVVIGAIAGLIDARTGRIPDRLVALASMPTLLVVAWATLDGSGPYALAAVVLGALVFALPLLVVHVVSPDALGFGDVKLAAALGAALGLLDARLGVLALCVAAALTAVVGLATRRHALPLGPGLVLGTAVALITFGQLDRGVTTWL